jgi:hypothetical protein
MAWHPRSANGESLVPTGSGSTRTLGSSENPMVGQFRESKASSCRYGPVGDTAPLPPLVHAGDSSAARAFENRKISKEPAPMNGIRPYSGCQLHPMSGVVLTRYAYQATSGRKTTKRARPSHTAEIRPHGRERKSPRIVAIPQIATPLKEKLSKVTPTSAAKSTP